METPENFPKKMIPKTLKLILAILFSLFILALTVSEALEIRDNLKIKDTIIFTGTGKVTGIPDVASITITVLTEKMKAADTMTENAKTMNQIIKFIKESGIDEKDIKNPRLLSFTPLRLGRRNKNF